MLYNHITEIIGNTPLLWIDPSVHRLANVELYAKLEHLNPFGSLKDRTAWGLVKDNIDQIVEKQQTIVEFSSGNTAKALSILASVYGVDCETITNRIKVPEVYNALKVVGTAIDTLPGTTECPDYMYLAQKMLAQPGRYYHTDQYKSADNYLAHHDTTGSEIFDDLGPVDYFYGGLGTAGSSRGVTEFLHEKNSALQSIGIVAELGNSIPGLRNIDEMQEMGIFQQHLYQDFTVVDIPHALDSMLTLIRRCGILAGPSSGAVYSGILQHLHERSQYWTYPRKVVFIVCDRMEWYLSYIQGHMPDLFDASLHADEKSAADILLR
jgi:cysteine synthase